MKIRALIVEDSPEDTKLLVRELQTRGYEVRHERVETAQSLKAALSRGGWDIVFCDYTLPRFSGQGALEMVRKWDADLPFVYVSGTIGEDVAVEAMKAGAQDYVMKDNLKRLAPAVERELREAQTRRQHRELEADRQQLTQDLQAALAEVKRLRGFLTICASCKNILNEHGDWQQMEKYIETHTDARFSHGLCPRCAARLYPDLELDLSEYEKTSGSTDG